MPDDTKPHRRRPVEVLDMRSLRPHDGVPLVVEDDSTGPVGPERRTWPGYPRRVALGAALVEVSLVEPSPQCYGLAVDSDDDSVTLPLVVPSDVGAGRWTVDESQLVAYVEGAMRLAVTTARASVAPLGELRSLASCARWRREAHVADGQRSAAMRSIVEAIKHNEAAPGQRGDQVASCLSRALRALEVGRGPRG